MLSAVFALTIAGLSPSQVAAHRVASCYDTATTQVALTRCAGLDARASATRVVAAFATLRATLTGAELRAAQADQTAWRAYVRANCASVSNVGVASAGSIAPMIDLQCMAQRNDERVKYLRWRASAPETRQQSRMP